MSVTLTLADDHAMLRTGLRVLIEASGHQVQHEVSDFQSLLATQQQSPSDILVLDCKMPGHHPIQGYQTLMELTPKSQIIYLTGLNSALLFDQLKRAGVSAIVSKQNEPSTILTAIEKVTSGEQYFCSQVQSCLDELDDSLTEKELLVLSHIVKGLSNNDIAKAIHKSPSTINTHRVNLMAKLKVHNAVDLASLAHESGLFEE